MGNTTKLIGRVSSEVITEKFKKTSISEEYQETTFEIIYNKAFVGKEENILKQVITCKGELSKEVEKCVSKDSLVFVEGSFKTSIRKNDEGTPTLTNKFEVTKVRVLDGKNQDHIVETNKMMYTEKDLVDFGNYLLSDKRNKRVENGEFRNFVHHSDLENWKDGKA